MKTFFKNIYDKFTYEHGAMLFALIQTLYAASIAISFNLKYNIYHVFPLLLIFYLIPTFFCFYFRELLNDLFVQFQYKEKFALFLGHLFFFLSPTFLGIMSFSLSAILMNFPLLLTLLRPHNFVRLYFWNSLILSCVILYNPNISIYYLFVFIILLTITMLFDYFFFKTEIYNETRKIKVKELAGIILSFVLFPSIIGLGMSFLIPEMQPVKFDELFKNQRHFIETQQKSQSLLRILIEAIILILLISLMLALLNYIQKKLIKKKVILPKGSQARIDEYEPKYTNLIKKKIFSVGNDIRSKIIHLYNLFIEETGEAGFKRKISSTPSEYASDFYQSFNYKFKDIFKITELFEKARYGKEVMDDTDLIEFEQNINPLKTAVKERYIKDISEKKDN